MAQTQAMTPCNPARTRLRAACLCGAGLVTLAGWAASGGAFADTPTCRIDQQASGGNVTLTGAVLADAPLSGRYRLEVTTHSAGGSSRVVQQGEFQARPDRSELLGQVTTRIGSRGRISAELSVTAADETICVALL